MARRCRRRLETVSDQAERQKILKLLAEEQKRQLDGEKSVLTC